MRKHEITELTYDPAYLEQINSRHTKTAPDGTAFRMPLSFSSDMRLACEGLLGQR